MGVSAELERDAEIAAEEKDQEQNGGVADRADLDEQVSEGARSVGSIDRPPSEQEHLPPAKVYGPCSVHVICLLIPGSILGVLARLGLLAIAKYDGESIFPLAYVQALGCFIMGTALGLKEPIGDL